jgi:hypothetical protein
MKNPFKYLIPAYYTALTGQITIGGSILKVYDGMVPQNASDSYILIGERTSGQMKAKCDFTSECYVLIDCVIKGNGFGFKDSEEAADQVLAIINSNANLVPSSSFQVATTSIQSINNLSALNPADNVFRTLIRFKNTVIQIS